MPLIALGALLAVVSYRQLQRNDRVLRLRRPLPASALPRILVCGVAGLAVAATGLTVVQLASP